MLYVISTLQYSAVITDGPGRNTSPPDRADDQHACFAVTNNMVCAHVYKVYTCIYLYILVYTRMMILIHGARIPDVVGVLRSCLKLFECQC